MQRDNWDKKFCTAGLCLTHAAQSPAFDAAAAKTRSRERTISALFGNRITTTFQSASAFASGRFCDHSRSQERPFGDEKNNANVAGLSGGRADNRPGLIAALRQACETKSALVVYSLSRLARSTKDTIATGEKLAKAGADLVSLSEKIDTTTAAGKMVFRMLAVMAEFERDQISERTTFALAHKKSKGQRVGTIPYGYDLADDCVTLVRNTGSWKYAKPSRNFAT